MSDFFKSTKYDGRRVAVNPREHAPKGAEPIADLELSFSGRWRARALIVGPRTEEGSTDVFLSYAVSRPLAI